MANVYQITEAARQILGHDGVSVLGDGVIEDGTLPPGEDLAVEKQQEIRDLAETLPVAPPRPPTEKIHAAWLKAYLAQQGWREELETIISRSGPIAQALWESGSTFSVTDKLVHDYWNAHTQSENLTVQEVFDAADALRRSVIEG